MKAAIVAHGDAVPADRAIAAGADLLIAADGGALQCSRWGLQPRLVVGDLDSLGGAGAEALARTGVEVRAYPPAKDESDTELAVRCAVEAGADEIVLLAALGGPRLDHELANILLLADERLRDLGVRVVRGGTTVRALHGPGRLALEGLPGDTVTLLPVGEAGRVVTHRLRYALTGETLHRGVARGLSNVIADDGASVSLGRGVLLVIEISRAGGVT